MIALVNDNLKTIRALCEKHHVQSLYLIGSAAGEVSFTDKSDIDFLYRFRKEEIAEGEYADNYFDLLFELEDVLKRKIDLVSEDKMWNPYFIESVNENKQMIYGA